MLKLFREGKTAFRQRKNPLSKQGSGLTVLTRIVQRIKLRDSRRRLRISRRQINEE